MTSSIARRGLATLLVMALLALLGAPAKASPQNYQLSISATSFEFDSAFLPEQCARLATDPAPKFGCDFVPGSYQGSFALADDPSALASGLHYLAMDSFDLQLGGVSWGTHPGQFYSGSFLGQCLTVGNGALLGTLVSGGAVSGFCGQVHATSSELPFIELNPDGTFWAWDYVATVRGSYSVAAVSEPSVLALAVVALFMLAACTRRGHAALREQERALRLGGGPWAS